MLDALITSKTRIKLLLKFFLNPDSNGNMKQCLSLKLIDPNMELSGQARKNGEPAPAKRAEASFFLDFFLRFVSRQKEVRENKQLKIYPLARYMDHNLIIN